MIQQFPPAFMRNQSSVGYAQGCPVFPLTCDETALVQNGACRVTGFKRWTIKTAWSLQNARSGLPSKVIKYPGAPLSVIHLRIVGHVFMANHYYRLFLGLFACFKSIPLAGLMVCRFHSRWIRMHGMEYRGCGGIWGIAYCHPYGQRTLAFLPIWILICPACNSEYLGNTDGFPITGYYRTRPVSSRYQNGSRRPRRINEIFLNTR